MIELKNISKSFNKKEVISNISLQIHKNEIIGLIGPNGSGKTTLIKMLVGFLTPTSGEIFIDGVNSLEIDNNIKSSISYLAEVNPLYLNMYVYEFLEFIAKIYNIPNQKIHSILENVINLCRLETVKKTKIHCLSKGYRQRIGIAKCLINNPKIIILDEPLSGIDPVHIIDIRNIIKDISLGRIIILSSHILEQVEKICNRIVILHKGKLILQNTAIEQHKNYKNIILELKEDVDKDIFEEIISKKLIIKKENRFIFRIEEDEKSFKEKIFLFIRRKGYTLLTLMDEEEPLEKIFYKAMKRGIN